MVKETENSGNGLFPLTLIKSGSLILSIPFSSLLTAASAIESPFRNISDEIREDDLLALLLLYEKFEKKELSRFYKHIQIIPEKYDSLVNYNTNELNYFQGSNLYVTATRWITQIHEDFQEVCGYNVDELSLVTAFPWFTFDNYIWGLSTIWSRFVTVKRNGTDYRAMVPVFDLLNHNPYSNVGHYFDDKDDQLHLYSRDAWTLGSEIFLNYGHVSNSRLLMLYGFVIPDNEFDTVDVYAQMSENAPDYHLKLGTLTQLNINCREPFPMGKSGVPDNLRIALRIQFAEPGTSEVANMLHAATGPLSPSNEDRVADALVAAFESMLALYETSLAEDDALLRGLAADSVNNVRLFNAVVLRMSEKQILQAAVSSLKVKSHSILNENIK